MHKHKETDSTAQDRLSVKSLPFLLRSECKCTESPSSRLWEHRYHHPQCNRNCGEKTPFMNILYHRGRLLSHIVPGWLPPSSYSPPRNRRSGRERERSRHSGILFNGRIIACFLLYPPFLISHSRWPLAFWPWALRSALWFRITKNWEVSTGLLVRPFATSLAPHIHHLAPGCSCCLHALLSSAALIHSLAD